MLKEKDKRIVLLVIFATAIVSLLTAIVASFISNLTELAMQIDEHIDPDSQWLWFPCFNLAYTLIGAGFASVFFFNKKRQMLANFICLGVLAAVFIVFAAVLYTSSNVSSNYCSSIFVAPALTIMISAAFLVGSKCLIEKLDSAKEEPATENNQGE